MGRERGIASPGERGEAGEGEGGATGEGEGGAAGERQEEACPGRGERHPGALRGVACPVACPGAHHREWRVPGGGVGEWRVPGSGVSRGGACPGEWRAFRGVAV